MKNLSSYIAGATKPACTIDLNSFEEIHHPLTDFDLELSTVQADLTYTQCLTDTLAATQTYLNELKQSDGKLSPAQGTVVASLVNQVNALHGDTESCSMEGITEDALDISMEGVRDAVIKMWETVKRVLAAAIKQVKEFFSRGANKVKAKAASTEKLLSRIAGLKGTPKEQKISFSGIGNLSVDGKICTIKDLERLSNILHLTNFNSPKVANVYKDFTKIAAKITSENIGDYDADIKSTITVLEEFILYATGVNGIPTKPVGPRGPGLVGEHQSATFPGEKQIHIKLTGGESTMWWNLMSSSGQPPETVPSLTSANLGKTAEYIQEFNADYSNLLKSAVLITDASAPMTEALDKSIKSMQSAVDNETFKRLMYIYSSVYIVLKAVRSYADVADKVGSALHNYVVMSAKNIS